jgi:hypothetical protein
MRGHSMGLEDLLILPRFNDREMTEPANLLEARRERSRPRGGSYRDTA